MAPVEPMESASEFLTLLKKVGDLQALSVAPFCLVFTPWTGQSSIVPEAGLR